MDLEEKADIVVDILTLTGQTMMDTKRVRGQRGQHSFDLTIPDKFPKGTYVVKIATATKVYFTKFIRL